MVANKMMVGKDEKLRVSAVFRATMMISRASRMFSVKKKSNINGGSGKINMVKMRITAMGMAKEVHGSAVVSCRRSDKLKVDVAISSLRCLIFQAKVSRKRPFPFLVSVLE